MQFKGKAVSAYTLTELKAADWELQGQEDNYLEALKHPKFEKMKPKPEMSDSWKQLRKEIKSEIEKRKENV